jgi:hypothetical protein
MTTVNELLSLALKDIGVIASGETMDPSTQSDALATFNQMIGQWQVQKMFVTGQHQVSFPVNGSQTYTIGPGAAVDVPLPASVDAAFWRFNNVDYPVSVLESFEDYENITLKTLASAVPTAIYFQRNYPTGTLYVWPQPSAGTLNLVLRDVLPTYTNATSDISVPDEYALAMRFSLAELLLTTFGMPPRADISALASRARKVMKRNNLSIPMMGQPQGPLSNGRFSIYTGQ